MPHSSAPGRVDAPTQMARESATQITAAVASERCLRIGGTIDGRVTKIVPYVGLLVDIGAGYDVLLPTEHYGKKLKRPRVGYELAYLDVLDLDPDATEECRRVILGAENCINLTPSPLLKKPELSSRIQSSPAMLTPTTSSQGSPQVSPKQDLPVDNLENFQLDMHALAPKTLDESVPLEDEIPDPFTRLRQTLLDKADELGVALPQLAPVLQSFDALELRMTVLDKAQELGVAESQLTPVLESINRLSRRAPTMLKDGKKKAPTRRTGRCWHGALSPARKALQFA